MSGWSAWHAKFMVSDAKFGRSYEMCNYLTFIIWWLVISQSILVLFLSLQAVGAPISWHPTSIVLYPPFFSSALPHSLPRSLSNCPSSIYPQYSKTKLDRVLFEGNAIKQGCQNDPKSSHFSRLLLGKRHRMSYLSLPSQNATTTLI